MYVTSCRFAIIYRYANAWPIPVAERSKTRDCSRSLAEIAGSNPARDTDLYLL